MLGTSVIGAGNARLLLQHRSGHSRKKCYDDNCWGVAMSRWELTLVSSVAFLRATPALGAGTPDSFRACVDVGTDGKSKIVVSGTVWEDGCTKSTSLVRAGPQGINPHMLMLKIDSKPMSGICPHNVHPKDLRYEKPAEKGDFTQVHIQNSSGVLIAVEQACT